MWQKQPMKSSYRESLKALEADIQYANTLAAALPRDYGGECLQMRLSYSPFAPFFLLLIEWMECSCTDTLPNYLGLHHILIYKIHVDGMTTISSHERRATLREFYAVIFPYLRQLQGDMTEFKDSYKRNWCTEVNDRIVVEERKFPHKDSDREDECGICMEACTKMVLPNCGHSMCIDCFRDWNLRSQSCPFCRGNLKRVNSDDLWVLTSDGDVVDRATLAKENLRRFYLYVDSLPLALMKEWLERLQLKHKVTTVLDELRRVFSSFKNVKVVHFSSIQDAFNGFTDKVREQKFRNRLKHYTGIWCCLSKLYTWSNGSTPLSKWRGCGFEAYQQLIVDIRFRHVILKG